MRILITGGTGFVGSNLVAMLARNNDVVTNGRKDEQQILPVRIYFQADFTQIDWSKQGTFDVVFHQAAINDTQFKDCPEMFRVNVDASMSLFRAVIANGCKRIVYASSTAVYGKGQVPFKEDVWPKPLTYYGESKRTLDELAMALAREHTDVTIVGLRYCNIYGPRENHKQKRASMIYQLAQQMLTGNPKLFEWGHHRRDFIYIDDVVEANLLAMQAKESCVVNCGTGKAVSFNEIVHFLNRTLGTNRKQEYIKNHFEKTYQEHTVCDMNLAKEKLGFLPKYSVEEGIKKYYESGWLKRNL
ncbi:NAD-dependent epimerase/dehydratase family protein [Candidatus Woesearchaeota archaeon]|nr:NAD-dependent epimerase/dehydratase family protein [Candidatus Woesearchaeota archaeon]